MHPLASPCTTLPDKWKGCPPVWIGVGGAEGVVDGARILARDVIACGGKVEWREYERMPHLWALVFKGWWQSRDVMERWASACAERAGEGFQEQARDKAHVLGVDGKEQDLDWAEIGAPGHREVLEQLEKAAAGMEVYEGQKEPLPKSLL